MIDKFVKSWDQNKHILEEKYTKGHPSSYEGIFKDLVQMLYDTDEDQYDGCPNPEKIHVIDDGDYQGTILFLVPENTYQPSTYYVSKCGYGSCSYCDTFQSIVAMGDHDDDYNKLPPNKQQIEEYMLLALHMLQGLKEI